MITAKFTTLVRTSHVYIKEGKLIKYRLTSNDVAHEDNYFSDLAHQQGTVSEDDLKRLKEMDNVVIETNEAIELFNFDEARKVMFEESDDFKRLMDSEMEYKINFKASWWESN